MSQQIKYKQKKLLTYLIAASITACLGVPQALAQATEDSEEPETTEEVVEEEEDENTVTVTGSRIGRAEFSQISPVQVIDGEVARALGLFDAASLLTQTTVIQGQQTTTGFSTSAGFQTDSGPGSASAALRGLDAGRTLVMINGRRLAPAGVRGAPSAPDLNLIPGSLIQRVDVLLDGASSVYGSDAVAGVTNYILRDDFDGLQVDYFTTDQRSVKGPGQDLVSLTWGANSDRGFIGIGAEYSRTGGYAESAFANFYEPYAGNCRSTYQQGISGEIYDACSGSFGAGSASIPEIGYLGYDGTSNITGLPPGWFQIGIAADLLLPSSTGGAALLFWPEELKSSFAPDFERKSFYSYGEYSPAGWYGDATTYFEASWANRLTQNDSIGQGNIPLPGDYAVGNFGYDGTLYFGQRSINDTEVSQTRFTTGIKGDLPILDGLGTLNNWTYDGYVNYSRSMGSDALAGLPYFPRLAQTLSNTRIDSDTGQAVCDPYTVAGEGQTVTCRPLNFLEPSFILSGRFSDPLDNAYLFPNRMVNTVVEQTTVNAFITGELFTLPSDLPASLVVGFEYRQDKIHTDTDAGAAGGDFFGYSADPGANGSRWLRETFIELDLPVLSDLPGIAELTFNLAGRNTEESNFGKESTYRFQGKYSPVKWLSVRGSVGTSFRAPNLGEQFGGAVTSFQDPIDPCRVAGVTVPFVDHDNDPSTPEVRLYDASLELREASLMANCINGGGPYSIPGTDPTALGVYGMGTASPIFAGANTLVASGSNPELEAETSKSKTYGIVFEQPWTDEFELSFSATYYDIKIDDQVDQLTARTIVNRCYNSEGLTDPTCAFITRDPRTDDETSGEISFVSALNQNLGSQFVEGIDYNIEFGTEITMFNLENSIDYNLIIRATQSRVDEEEEFTVDGIIIDDDFREYGNPEWRVNITHMIGFGDWLVMFQSRYISDMIEDNDDPYDPSYSFFSPCRQAGDYDADNPDDESVQCNSYDQLDSYWLHDISGQWSSDDYIVRIGMINVFNDAPPLTNNNDLGNLAGIGYNITGRTVFLNITAAF